MTAEPDAQPKKPVGDGDQVILVDGSSFIFRAYFQSINQDQKYNTRPSDGLPTGAVRLFCTKIAQFLQDGAAGIKPSHLGIVFDKSENSFRKALYPEYKAHRPDAPDDLKRQMPLMRDAVRAFGLHAIEMDTYEADDLIATYARQAEARGAGVIIVSSDKDLMQLVSEKIRFYDFESGAKGKPGYRPERNLDAEAIVAKWEGLNPDQIGDALALIGDTSDNVPGVPGIGLKTAAALIKEYGGLEPLLERAGEIKQPKRRETLLANIEQARLSRKLVALVEDVAVPVALDELGVPQPDPQKLVGFLKAMEFNTLTRRIADMLHVDPEKVKPDPALAPGARGDDGIPFDDPETEAGGADRGPGEAPPDVDPFADLDLPDAPIAKKRGPAEPTPSSVVSARAAESVKPFDTAAYETIRSREQLDVWIAEAFEAGIVAVDTETDALDAQRAGLVGVSLCVGAGRAAYIPLAHVEAKGGDLFGEKGASEITEPVEGQIPLKEAMAALKPLLEDPGTLKIGQNIKYDLSVLARYGIAIAPFDDTMLISYVLDAGKGGHGMDELSKRHLGHTPITFSDVTGTGRNKITFERVPLDKATAYAAEDADVTFRLWRMMKPRLAAERRVTVYETLERPLIPVLARMEAEGIRIDRNMLSRLSGDFSQILARLEEEIQEDAGEKFQVGSPKQIGDILFGKMGLPGAKKTPSGQWATPATLLEELAQAGHDLPKKILNWRQLSKLKSTYTDTLQEHADRSDDRIHTSFALAATTTGRLSSSEPNLQNIPIRTEEGRRIRKAFVAPEGTRLISADYSQIELRLLAHIADIPQLREAFEQGLDIHAATASAMFSVPLDQMTGDLRRKAKTINFGIIYGISAFGLADRLGIGREEASAFIKQYFERFPGIRDYIDTTKKACREQGYVKTLFGRICHYPQIRSNNPNERASVERQAINAPIQGTAADIIRRAMIRMEGALKAERLNVRMLLQVHDELVFEAPEEEIDAAIPVIQRVMVEAPAPAVVLRVPLVVEARAAGNWEEAH
ncbi:DNA polymerase I [Methylobacterium haplocladii]|uniref:DNA polymerase I n=1 Tax=Methylobacterium haplocladii TaxID=1176176 RepID=A0A512IQX9_9HYPH|nr:DNA polymerase I [Methylobacterium haplocladii]GEP00108.1 DNA polymerase I [Methylobacterium haplocladii]GJD85360.1 DNA polymerase I [Methylobacterium haplocladii]GLS58156.1 DNA polymerase I [Methylobacterium haplocladii]